MTGLCLPSETACKEVPSSASFPDAGTGRKVISGNSSSSELLPILTSSLLSLHDSSSFDQSGQNSDSVSLVASLSAISEWFCDGRVGMTVAAKYDLMKKSETVANSMQIFFRGTNILATLGLYQCWALCGNHCQIRYPPYYQQTTLPGRDPKP